MKMTELLPLKKYKFKVHKYFFLFNVHVQKNFNGLNPFGTMKICLRKG